MAALGEVVEKLPACLGACHLYFIVACRYRGLCHDGDVTRSDFWIYAALLAVVFALYAQVHNFEFVNFDDPVYVTQNPHVRDGLTLDGLKWTFTSGYAANWFPLTWISYMLDVQIFGLSSGAQHLTNVFLHAVSSLLLFALMKRMTGARWPSAFVAFAFAVHPLHVESVAWIAERKDVLSGLFWFLTLWAYLNYVERPSRVRYSLVARIFRMRPDGQADDRDACPSSCCFSTGGRLSAATNFSRSCRCSRWPRRPRW